MSSFSSFFNATNTYSQAYKKLQKEHAVSNIVAFIQGVDNFARKMPDILPEKEEQAKEELHQKLFDIYQSLPEEHAAHTPFLEAYTTLLLTSAHKKHLPHAVTLNSFTRHNNHQLLKHQSPNNGLDYLSANTKIVQLASQHQTHLDLNLISITAQKGQEIFDKLNDYPGTITAISCLNGLENAAQMQGVCLKPIQASDNLKILKNICEYAPSHYKTALELQITVTKRMLQNRGQISSEYALSKPPQTVPDAQNKMSTMVRKLKR